MRLSDAERVSRAIRTLSGNASLDTIVDRLYDLTEGSLALEECIRLYFALMIVGCEQDIATATIVDEGRSMLAGFIGEPLASLIFRDLEQTLPKLVERVTLKEYLEEGLRVWLPK